MALSDRDCRHGRQIGKCVDCDLDHMEMAADAEARMVDELTALHKQDTALIRQLTDLVQAQHDYIMALPADVVASLPAMPGFDGDLADEIKAAARARLEASRQPSASAPKAAMQPL